MKTTIDTITDEQIEALRREADDAGDLAMLCICRVALGEEYAWAADETFGYERPGCAASAEEQEARRFSTYEKARAECARVIADAASK